MATYRVDQGESSTEGFHLSLQIGFLFLGGILFEMGKTEQLRRQEQGIKGSL